MTRPSNIAYGGKKAYRRKLKVSTTVRETGSFTTTSTTVNTTFSVTVPKVNLRQTEKK